MEVAWLQIHRKAMDIAMAQYEIAHKLKLHPDIGLSATLILDDSWMLNPTESPLKALLKKSKSRSDGVALTYGQICAKGQTKRSLSLPDEAEVSRYVRQYLKK
jgi:hypothetical protein